MSCIHAEKEWANELGNIRQEQARVQGISQANTYCQLGSRHADPYRIEKSEHVSSNLATIEKAAPPSTWQEAKHTKPAAWQSHKYLALRRVAQRRAATRLGNSLAKLKRPNAKGHHPAQS